MMNRMQLALMKKDIRGITSNKQVFSVMLMVPLALTIILPSIFVFVTVLVPDTTSDFQKLLEMLPSTEQIGNQKQMILGLLLNKIMPVFFLMIPIMASSVMAASSFVGEKEKHTLETLLYSPLSLKQLFQSKILASFSVSMMVSFISFAAMIVVMEIEVLLLTGSAVMPDLSWMIIMLLIAPSISLVAISITVRGSAKAQTIEEAQQRAVFLVFPIIALVIGQFTGIIMVSTWILLGLGIVLPLIAALLVKGSVGKFTYEKLLR
ncbi:ABC transporter permease [Muricomes intestini]|uniref:ABC-2 family transporter n=1 Tax=Muricomes intestini TaxID=1796634 RepID=A0A4R3JZS0_9FIRM|nr:ABC transporter permease [Muricomes intestini]TCS74688.1 ABC-2 family transporter [Muricomes intestini]HAX51088.1 ABC transporter permease [Lachnospiraceae bacterium]HBI74295.1 ABC transporter permease [Lachnospiraceae bacterium]HCR82350.1 ABC transporter permease [Lachnospiraceae bacterium]